MLRSFVAELIHGGGKLLEGEKEKGKAKAA